MKTFSVFANYIAFSSCCSLILYCCCTEYTKWIRKKIHTFGSRLRERGEEGLGLQKTWILIKAREKSNVTRSCSLGLDPLLKLLEEQIVSENCPKMQDYRTQKQPTSLEQILNLSETSQDNLASFQGHNIRVHREFYRLPENALKVAKVSKVLHSINNGAIQSTKAWTLMK